MTGIVSVALLRSSRHFTEQELVCRCCSKGGLDADFLALLEDLRAAMGRPLTVTSGYRCPTHNMAVSKTGPTGSHTTGRAVDIAIEGEQAYRLLAFATLNQMTGLGIKQHGASRWLHLDNLTAADGFPRPRCWTY